MCLKSFSCSWSFLVIAWIQRLEEFEWDLLLKKSADMKCAVYEQHVGTKLNRNSILFINFNNFKMLESQISINLFGALK